MQTRPPGSYIEDAEGNTTPNLQDEAMAARVKAKDEETAAAAPKKEKADAPAKK